MSDAEVSPGMSVQAIADLASSKLRASPDPAPDSATGDGPNDPPETQTGDDAPDDSPPSVENAPAPDPEPQAPSVEPPASWTPTEKEAFRALPPDKQQVIADRERDRSKTYRQAQDEAAAARKEREAITAERQQYAGYLHNLAQQIQVLDPIIAEGQRTDWAKLAQENPADFVAKKAAFDQRVGQIQQLNAERDRVSNQVLGEAQARMVQTLRSDDSLGLHDDAKWQAFNSEVTKYLMDSGFPVQQIRTVTDAMVVKIAHKAMMYDRQQADRKAIESKKTAPAPKRTIAPGAADDGARGASPRLEAAERAAIKSGNPRRMAEVAMARLRASPNPS